MKQVGLAVLVLASIAGAGWGLSRVGEFRRDGELHLAALERPVRVLRDGAGVPYIFAESTPDLIRAQGFVTAQHRLFQLEAYRAILSGRLAEAIGERGLRSDIRMRVLGVRRNAMRHTAVLSDESRAFLGWFVEGLNAYVEGYPEDHHLEFSLAPFHVGTWAVEDIVAIVHFVHHRQAANLEMELLAQRLVDRVGTQAASDIMPITVNPDRRSESRTVRLSDDATVRLDFDREALLLARTDPVDPGFGSNNWVVAPEKSASGHAMVANDPHLDSRVLPGIWHPVGLFTPEIRAIGAALPGVPGILVGRNAHVAFGVTNSYGDVQDVYVETVDPHDPARYLDGSRSLPFEIREETIRVRDDAARGGFREQTLRIRFTRRGPVLSDHGLGPAGDKLLVLRTTAAEVHGPVIGVESLLTAGSVEEFDHALAGVDLLMFNFVFADDDGHIGQRAVGAVPVREARQGGIVHRPPADGTDDWTGFIPKDEMPGGFDPARGWLGTANHDTRPDDYPYYYSSFFSPSYRYRRIRQVLDAAEHTTVDDHWQLIRDIRNLQSDRMRGVFADALEASGRHRDLAAILRAWDGRDTVDSPAPLVYQALYRQFAIETYRDELGDELAAAMLETSYFWKERLDAMVATGDSPWFDDVTTTDRVESLRDIVVAAAGLAREGLEERFGDDPLEWRWGDAHTITFVSPLRRAGFGSDLLGAGTHALPGSGDTLNRGRFAFGGDYGAKFHDSMRIVVDLGDPEKIAAVIAGGVVGRQFHEHQADQVEPWVRGEIRYWWFDQASIEANARHEQWLVP